MSQDVQLFFQSLDQDEDGLISAQDIYTAIKSQGWKGDFQHVQKIFSKMDLNGDGTLNFEEMEHGFEHLLLLVSDSHDHNNSNNHHKKEDSENDIKPDPSASQTSTSTSTRSKSSSSKSKSKSKNRSKSSSKSAEKRKYPEESLGSIRSPSPPKLLTSSASSSSSSSSSSFSSSTTPSSPPPLLPVPDQKALLPVVSNTKNRKLSQGSDAGGQIIEGEEEEEDEDDTDVGEGRILTEEDMDNMKGVAPAWIDDNSVLRCMERTCQKVFGIFLRRHHCRHCGGVFCHQCTSHNIKILKFGYHEPVRVCEPCYLLITKEISNDPSLKPIKVNYKRESVTGPTIAALPFAYTQASTGNYVK